MSRRRANIRDCISASVEHLGGMSLLVYSFRFSVPTLVSARQMSPDHQSEIMETLSTALSGSG